MAATIDPFLYSIAATVRQGKTPEQVLAALDGEVRRVVDDPVSEAELKRAVKQARAIFAYGSETVTNQAFWMGYAEIFASYDWFENYIEKLDSVTPDDVQHAARKYLARRNRTVGFYLPTQESPGG